MGGFLLDEIPGGCLVLGVAKIIAVIAGCCWVSARWFLWYPSMLLGSYNVVAYFT